MERLSIGTTGWVGLHARDYARRFDVIEFNWTFHERDETPEKFEKIASELKLLRLQAFIKVSGLATHEHRLRKPEDWWPQLWSKYGVLHREGVLAGLLWQFAPSHRYSFRAFDDLQAVAKLLPREALHVFEFRHSSWYDNASVLDLLRRHKMCMAWINIVNEDSWCGDLPSGWATKARTCDALYFRLFGTKRKAIGRYSEAFMQNEILPHVRGANAHGEAYVVFAQADVPEHAKADATALIDLLGRTAATASRSTRWERDVLAATLGLDIGSEVEGVVIRISHRAIFLDIGHSCKATIDVNHARRVGLLDNVRLGTRLHSLIVENLDFQGQTGIAGLSCHNCEVGTVAANHSKALNDVTGLSVMAPPPEGEPGARADVEPEPAPARSRWKRHASSQAPLTSIPEAGSAAEIGSQCQVGEASESSEVCGADVRPYGRPRATRWGQRFGAPSRSSSADDESCNSSVVSCIGNVADHSSVGASDVSDSESAGCTSSSSRGWLLPERFYRTGVDHGSDVLDTDDLLVMQLEHRENLESGADFLNAETFGEDYDPEGWTAEEMFRANELLEGRASQASTHRTELPSTEEESSSVTATSVEDAEPRRRKRGQNKIPTECLVGSDNLATQGGSAVAS